ncbi:MAG TPA: MobA/MobL family protein [Gemmatimonadaceae bacterium]|nr:MobA/MobL family protein [Gemmatimonadaceae bacterium]
MEFEFDSRPPAGGRAKGGRGSIHLSFRSGSRASGASGASSHDYITREGEYSGPERDPAIHTESGHMPSWAEEDPREYWDAADLHERANGRLFVAADFALPRELSTEDQIELARRFAREMTDQERLPYTLAIHRGGDGEGHAHNPHAHLMFSERRNDGIERSEKDWFRRADSDQPDRGGTPKSRTFHGSHWVEHSRERWAAMTNEALERAGRAERVDHRSYERQGIDREPGRHYGPMAAHVAARGDAHDRLDAALTPGDERNTIQAIENEIARLEQARDELVQYGLPEDRTNGRSNEYSGSSGADRSDDNSWGR